MHRTSDQNDPSQSSMSATSETDRQGAHIFRLGYPQSFGRLRWDNNAHVLVDAAQVVGVPVQHFTCYHYLMVAPDDVSEQEESIISTTCR